LELLSLSLNNSKGFSKKVMIFSGFQAFRIIACGLVDHAAEPRFEKDRFIPGGVPLDRQGRGDDRRILYFLIFMIFFGCADSPEDR
jgi:hypothetical protein